MSVEKKAGDRPLVSVCGLSFRGRASELSFCLSITNAMFPVQHEKSFEENVSERYCGFAIPRLGLRLLLRKYRILSARSQQDQSAMLALEIN